MSRGVRLELFTTRPAPINEPMANPADIYRRPPAADGHRARHQRLRGLKKKGANWMACCPFHQEKTPSFSVNPAKDIFYCFGCQKGGCVFNFVMEMERVSFPEAVDCRGEVGDAAARDGGGQAFRGAAQRRR